MESRKIGIAFGNGEGAEWKAEGDMVERVGRGGVGDGCCRD